MARHKSLKDWFSRYQQTKHLYRELQENINEASTELLELDSKKNKLKELEEKELSKPLPIDTQISILEKEIKALSNKSTKTREEQSLLESKNKELEELLKKQNNSNSSVNKDKSDKTLVILRNWNNWNINNL